MKPLSFICLIVFSISAMYGCKKYDNTPAPSITLTGKLVYNGDSIGVADSQVPLQLYQYGLGKVGPINLTFTQSGGFSELLFAGNYKLIIPSGQGPFLWKKTAAGNPDSLSVTVNNNMTVDVPVTPYYMIRNPQIVKSGTNIVGTFKAEKIITDANARNIEFVAIYLNKTTFVSNVSDQIMVNADGSPAQTKQTAIADPNNISLSIAVPPMPVTQNYVFARMGIKIAGVEDMIFSPVVKIAL